MTAIINIIITILNLTVSTNTEVSKLNPRHKTIKLRKSKKIHYGNSKQKISI